MQLLTANDFFNQAYVIMPPLKSQKERVQRAFQLVNTRLEMGDSSVPGEGMETHVYNVPCSMYLFICLLSLSFNILCNKLVI